MSTLDDIKAEINNGAAQLFDVREADEWAAGHLIKAVHVPLSGLKNDVVPEGLDKSKKTYLHCRSGARVQVAAPILEDLGFDEVEPLAEGFDELVDEGFDQA